MGLLSEQADVSSRLPMPVERMDDSSVVNTASAETFVWYYSNSGVWAAGAGQVAGTIVWAKTTYDNILNSAKTNGGHYGDTSVSFAAATRASTLVSVPEDVFSRMVLMTPADQITTITPYLDTAGDYAIDHRRGQVWLNSKAQVANDSITYSYKTPITGGSAGDKVDIIKVAGKTMAADDAAFTPGTSGMITIGAFADETATDSVDEGDTGAIRMTLNRRLIMADNFLDDSAFGVGTDYVSVSGYLADETTPDSVNEGDIGVARMTLDRKQLIASNQILGTATYTEGTTYGNVMGAVRNDTLAALADTDNELAPLQVNASGALYTINEAIFADDASFTLATSKVMVGGAFAEDPTSMTAVDAGDITVNKTDLFGRANVTLGTALSADQDSISTQPVEPSNGNTAAYAASVVIKASAGTLYAIRGYNSGAAQFIQVLDAAALPADTAVPEETFTVAAASNFFIEFPQGKSLGTGIVVCNSSTGATKTIGAADCWFSYEYL